MRIFVWRNSVIAVAALSWIMIAAPAGATDWRSHEFNMEHNGLAAAYAVLTIGQETDRP